MNFFGFYFQRKKHTEFFRFQFPSAKGIENPQVQQKTSLSLSLCIESSSFFSLLSGPLQESTSSAFSNAFSAVSLGKSSINSRELPSMGSCVSSHLRNGLAPGSTVADVPSPVEENAVNGGKALKSQWSFSQSKPAARCCGVNAKPHVSSHCIR